MPAHWTSALQGLRSHTTMHAAGSCKMSKAFSLGSVGRYVESRSASQTFPSAQWTFENGRMLYRGTACPIKPVHH